MEILFWMRKAVSLLAGFVIGLTSCGNERIINEDSSGGGGASGNNIDARGIQQGSYVGTVQCRKYACIINDCEDIGDFFYGPMERIIGDNGLPIMNDLRNEIRRGHVVTVYTPFGNFEGDLKVVDSWRNKRGYDYILDAGWANGNPPRDDLEIIEEASRIDENNLDFYIEGTNEFPFSCEGVLSRITN